MATSEELQKNLEVIEKDLLNREKTWNETISKLSRKISCELKETIELSAEAISQRQILIDERTQYYFKIYKQMPKLKQERKKLFEYFSTKYAIKANGTEKTKLIEAEMAYHDACMEYYNNHIQFLNDSIKSVDHIIYSVKNKIELYNATGLE